MKKIILILAISTGFVMSYAIAQPGKNDERRGKGQRGQNCEYSERGPRDGRGMMKLPDLTEAQITKIEDLRVAHFKETKSLKDEATIKRAELHALTTAEKVNMNQVNSLIEEIGAIQIDLQKRRVAHRQEIRNLLTEKQRIIFDSRGSMSRGRGMGEGKRSRY